MRLMSSLLGRPRTPLNARRGRSIVGRQALASRWRYGRSAPACWFGSVARENPGHVAVLVPHSLPTRDANVDLPGSGGNRRKWTSRQPAVSDQLRGRHDVEPVAAVLGGLDVDGR